MSQTKIAKPTKKNKPKTFSEKQPWICSLFVILRRTNKTEIDYYMTKRRPEKEKQAILLPFFADCYSTDELRKSEKKKSVSHLTTIDTTIEKKT